MQNVRFDTSRSAQLTATWVEPAIRLGVLALLLYWSFILVRPFISIALWSVVLTVALYPVYEWLVRLLGGRRRLAAVVLTTFGLLIVIGPAAWLVLSVIDSIRTLSTEFDIASLALPPPPDGVKNWPLIGNPIYQFWTLASSNLQEAATRIAPYLKPLGSSLLGVAAEAGTGTVKFLVSLVVAGFLFAPAPSLVNAVKMSSRKLTSERGEEFVQLAAATIRAVSRGVIGISVLQALLAGIGFAVAGVPGSSLLTSAVLILGIIQIGPSLLLIPVMIWSWWTMDMLAALLFTAYMIPVSLIDNILRPLVMGRGLNTPMLIILIGVLGGTISYGITGLFLGPIILAVIWELAASWLKEQGN